MLVDKHLSDDEVFFLRTWLEENDEIAFSWPGEVVYKRVNQVLDDGAIDSEERNYLAKTLEEIIGGDFHETGATGGEPTSLPVQEVSGIEFDGRSFCFTDVPVAEPGTLVLLGLGLVGMGMTRRRKKV